MVHRKWWLKQQYGWYRPRPELCVNIDGEPVAYRKVHAGFGEGHPETRSSHSAGGRRMPTLQKYFDRDSTKMVIFEWIKKTRNCPPKRGGCNISVRS